MASRSRALVKTVLLNLLIFFVGANVLYWAIPVGGAVSRLYKTSAVETWFRTIPPSYADTEPAWVRRHWMELNRGETVYKSYVGWRHAATAGETITVEGPYLQRRTVNTGTTGERKTYFFGGSTLWGLGSDDAGTIPSQFAARTGIHSENFGEHGWIAHQSLLLLIQLLEAGHRPDLVVFYNGGIEIQKCRSEIGPEAHERERLYGTVLHNSLRPDSFSHFLAPVIMLGQRLNLRLGLVEDAQWYECHSNARKVEAIAENLIQDWSLAKRLVESYGGKFVGLLEPVGYFSRTRLDYVKLPPYEQAQYAAVYAAIRAKIAGKEGFYDLTSVLDIDEAIYLDCCHVPRKGNRYVVEKLAEIVAPLGFKR